MKKYIFIFLILLLIPATGFSQKWRDGRWFRNGTISSAKLVDATVANGKLATTAVDGSVMLEATRSEWFPATAESDSDGVWKGTGAWTLDGSNPPTVIEIFGTDGTALFTTFGFEADNSGTDDVAYLTFPCPDDYETDSMELYLYWFHLDDNGAAADTVEWQGTVNAVGETEDLMAAGTAFTAVLETCAQSDSALYIANIDPEVETIAAGDLITVELSVDVSDSGLDTGENAHLLGVKVAWEAKDE